MAQRVFHSARTWGNDQLHGPTLLPNQARLPMLAGLNADGSARFGDGTVVERLDAIVYCTGYKYTYPFLERTGLLSTGETPAFWITGSNNILFVAKIWARG